MKRILSLCLAICLIFFTTTNFAADSLGSTGLQNGTITISAPMKPVSNTSDFNLSALSERFAYSPGIAQHSQNTDETTQAPKNSDITIQLLFEPANSTQSLVPCSSQGQFSVNGSSHNFEASGLLDIVDVEGKSVYIGSLSGFTDGQTDIDSMIGISICYRPDTEEKLISLSCGAYGGDRDETVPVAQVEYGEMFDLLAPATELHFAKKNNINASNASLGDAIEEQNDALSDLDQVSDARFIVPQYETNVLRDYKLSTYNGFKISDIMILGNLTAPLGGTFNLQPVVRGYMAGVKNMLDDRRS